MPPDEHQQTLATLAADADALAIAMMSRCVAEIPEYARLPASVLSGDLVANATAVFTLFLRTAGEGRVPTEEELALPISWGAERARDGLPLQAVLKTYPIAAQEVVDRVLAADLPPAEVALIVEHALVFLAEVVPRVAVAYLRERDDVEWEQREHRQTLASSLLAGRPARRTAERLGRHLADGYEVVVFRLPVPPDDTATRVTIELFRAIQTRLDTRPEVLAAFEGDGGVLLCPTDAEVVRDGGASRSSACELLALVDDAVSMRCTAAASTAHTRADIPFARAEAGEVLALAAQLGRAPGLYRLADLAIEYQLARPSPARTALADVLRPLQAHPHLVDALRAFLGSGSNRGAAAAALHLHRNTLTYRLGRVAQLTGYDATRSEDARQLAAAITALDVISRTDQHQE